MPSSNGGTARSTEVARPADGFALIGRDPPAAATADMALPVGENGSGHEGVGGDAVGRPAAGGVGSEQDVSGLGLPVSQPQVVGPECEVQVVEDHRRELVAL